MRMNVDNRPVKSSKMHEGLIQLPLKAHYTLISMTFELWFLTPLQAAMAMTVPMRNTYSLNSPRPHARVDQA